MKEDKTINGYWESFCRTVFNRACDLCTKDGVDCELVDQQRAADWFNKVCMPQFRKRILLDEEAMPNKKRDYMRHVEEVADELAAQMYDEVFVPRA